MPANFDKIEKLAQRDVAGMMSGFKKFVHKKIDEKVKRENLQPVPISRRAIDDIG